MGLKKGQSGNPNGRPKGTPNKITGTVRQWLIELIQQNREQLAKDLQTLEPKDRLLIIERFLPYILPKVERAEDVEGAAFTKEDITNEFDRLRTGGKKVSQWYDKKESI